MLVKKTRLVNPGHEFPTKTLRQSIYQKSALSDARLFGAVVAKDHVRQERRPCCKQDAVYIEAPISH